MPACSSYLALQYSILEVFVEVVLHAPETALSQEISRYRLAHQQSQLKKQLHASAQIVLISTSS